MLARLELRKPPYAVLGIALRSVLAAVHLNDQSVVRAQEIDDKSVDLDLAPELSAV